MQDRSPIEQSPLAPLTPTERDMFARASQAPMDVVQGEVKTYIDRMIELKLNNAGSSGTSGSSGTAAYYVPGDIKVTLADLTAQTSEYVFEDDSGQWLYCNGVAVSQTTYADLYAAVGANAYGTDSGGNFFLPDPRGRALFFTGTHTNADLGDNDGVAVASRTAKHSHTNGATITGAPGVGSLAVNPGSHSHTGVVTGGTAFDASAGAAAAVVDDLATGSTATTALSIAGAPDAGTLAVGGTIGTGTPVDTPAHLFIGSLLVRF
jgi:microcystin-dependent protein